MYQKLMIQGQIEVLTGLHIGASDVYAAIGAANSPVVRDPKTQYPIIPGSSLKGKIRTLLVRDAVEGYVLPEPKDDPPPIARLFGKPASSAETKAVASRLQFMDCFLANADELMDTSFTEVKTENSINRLTSIANPRPLERVIRGAKFSFAVIYNVENPAEVEEDFQTLAKGMQLLQLDYLGGHGSRGSGRIRFEDLKVIQAAGETEKIETLQKTLEGVKDANVLPL